MIGLLKIFKNGKLLVEITGEQLKEEYPDWDGKLGPGDTFHIGEEEVRVVSINVPLSTNDETYDVFVKNINDSIYAE